MTAIPRESLERAILTFAAGLSVTPTDQPARRQPPGRRRAPVMARDVLIDGMVAAADLLLETSCAPPAPNQVSVVA